jgi:alpha-amylase
MRSICFYFQVHQPYRLKQYRFFDIGKDHHYYDDYQNSYIARRVADKCYLPMNQLLLDAINEFGSNFKEVSPSRVPLWTSFRNIHPR